jgi:hypothetical protein
MLHKSPNRTYASSLPRFLYHTQFDAHPVGLLRTSDQLVAEAATSTTHNEHKRWTCMPSAGFKLAITVIKRLQASAFRQHGYRYRLHVELVRLYCWNCRICCCHSVKITRFHKGKYFAHFKTQVYRATSLEYRRWTDVLQSEYRLLYF